MDTSNSSPNSIDKQSGLDTVAYDLGIDPEASVTPQGERVESRSIKPPGRISWSKWRISCDQMATFISTHQLFIERMRSDYFGIFPVQARPAEMREEIRQLEIQQVMLNEDQDRLLSHPNVGPRSRLQRAIYAIYLWSRR